MKSQPSPHAAALVDLPDAVLWSSRTWTEFQALPFRAKHLVVLPLFGCADWGLGRPLDLEETLGTSVLRAALATTAGKKLPLTIMPPLRWVLGPYPHTLFGLDFATAGDLLRAIGASVRAAGFRKLILFNTSPWNEEFVDVGGRDLRVDLGLQTFCVNLSALQLDLHPVRSASRTLVQCAATVCYQALPNPDDPVRENITLRDFRPGHIAQPGPLPFTLSLEEAVKQGEKHLAAAGRRLAALWGEIHARRPLAADGAIPAMQPPKLKRPKSPARPISAKRRAKR